MWNKMLQSGSGGGGETPVTIEKLEFTTRITGTITLDLGGAYKFAIVHIGNTTKSATDYCFAYDSTTDTIINFRSTINYSPKFDAVNGTLTLTGSDSVNSFIQVLVIR